ncbi:hypothetical protein [Lignipirellula cremea]|uniref:Tetratricopeptide repeat protein n=1 Tax=Lignipirellula cremea TaxID=2528010 RepID=A0A518DM06_9BACT|nr:hypothetical protein [Lignipirellula cremea]QDU92853.1 hypothetical protein Pla8534_06260 [Lignipirellula cremea]
MKRWLLLLWLLVPVALLSYHFGPGQAALAYRQSQQNFQLAQELEETGHFDEAIDQYGEALSSLPATTEPAAVARDQIRLAQVRVRFQQGRLAETLSSLGVLVEEIEQTHGADSALAYETRDFLGRVHYQAMAALRLESAEKEVWLRHWELSRQNYRYLAEHTPGGRNDRDRRNLEVVIKSFNDPVPPTAASAAGGGFDTAGLTDVITPPPPDAPIAPGFGPPPPTVIDARPREPTPESPAPELNEFDLGS